MEKLKDIIADIQAIIVIILDDLVTLAFTPIWVVIDIIEKSIDVCTPAEEAEEVEEKPEQGHKVGFRL